MQNQEVFDQFLKWLGGSRSKETVKSYNFALYGLRRFLGESGLNIEQCTLDDLSTYIHSMENRALKPSTRAIYATALRCLWKWLFVQGRVSFAETLIPSPPPIDKEPMPFLEPHVFERLMSGFDETFPKELRNKTIISLLYNGGQRIGELLNMNVDDIDLENMKGLSKTFKRKNHKREIYWDPRTNELLRKWMQVREAILKKEGMLGMEALFIAMNTARPTERMKKCSVQKMFREVRARLGIEQRISPHSCRHGFGYRGTKNEVNIRYLQVMMGHAKITTTQQYMGWKQQEVEDEYRKMMAKMAR